MFWIILLLVVGIILFFAELFLIPGLSIAAIGAFSSLIASVSLAFVWYSQPVGYIVLSIAVCIIVITTLIFLRAKTWRKISLNTKINSTVETTITTKHNLKGKQATTLGRLAPMGQIVLEDGSIIEARCLTTYLDPRTKVIINEINDTHAIVSPIDKSTIN